MVTSSTPDPNIDNNKDNFTTEIKQKAVLDVKKTVNETVVIAGNSIHYTITIINNGPSYGLCLVIKDNLTSIMLLGIFIHLMEELLGLLGLLIH